MKPGISNSISNIRKDLPLPLRVGYGWVKRKLLPHPTWGSEDFDQTLTWLQKTGWWSKDQLEEMQLKELQALVKHAYEYVPYYRRIFDERRLKPHDIVKLDDLQKLPTLTKADVRDNLDDLIMRNIDRSRLIRTTTNGTTGKPLTLYSDKYTRLTRDFAFMMRQWYWAGYRCGDRLVILRGNLVSQNITKPEWKGRRRCWDYNTDSNELVLSSMDMSEENMHRYVELIREFKPKFIFAYPSSIEILARFLVRNGIRDIKVNAVFCESENVYTHQREIVKSTLGCEIFAGYGHSERAVDAVECEQHNGYHVSMEYGIFELLDKNSEVIKEPSRTGRVVATGFGNYCMPLIRYETDDLANYAANECICGRQLTLIQYFRGRIREFVVSKTGYLVPFTACYPNLTHSLDKISCFNYIQEHEGELIVQIVVAPPVSKEIVEREFLEEIYKRLEKKEFDVNIIFVDRIPRSISGKLAFLEQRMPITLGDIDQGEIASDQG